MNRYRAAIRMPAMTSGTSGWCVGTVPRYGYRRPAGVSSAEATTPARPVVPEHGAFDLALGGTAERMYTDDGRTVPLAVRRWRQPAAGHDQWLLARCGGPTMDVGCGPGRLVAALLDAGIPALGVDQSPHAGRSCPFQAVLCRDVFDPLPGEGDWSHVLLADGNIGIGGDPVPLLRRCAQLLTPRGCVLVEVEPEGTGLWRGHAQLRYPSSGRPRGPWFRWAQVGLDALDQVAAHAGLRVDTHHHGTGPGDARCFAQLTPRTSVS